MKMNDFDSLEGAIKEFQVFLHRNLSYMAGNKASITSSFWAEHFRSRPNFPMISELPVFRRSGYMYGIGVSDNGQTNDSEAAAHSIASNLVDISRIPREFYEKIHEPSFGAPYVFPFKGKIVSPSFLVNLVTSYRISKIINRNNLSEKKLNVIEIGAGWGCVAFQIHHIFDIKNYVVIDLPENLFLSSIYLSVNLAHRASGYLDCNSNTPIPEMNSDALHFTLPPISNSLQGNYEVIINTFSFQEMDLESVKSYFSMAERLLGDDGIFISINSHGKAGVTKPSDYLNISSLRLENIEAFRDLPVGLFNTIPYELTFKKHSGCSNGKKLSIVVDALGEMMQLGLQEDLLPYLNLADVQKDNVKLEFLDGVSKIFQTENKSGQQSRLLLLADKFPSPISSYLLGCHEFMAGNFLKSRKNLELSLSCGLTGFASILAKIQIVLATKELADKRNADYILILEDLKISAGALYPEIARLIENKGTESVRLHLRRVFRTLNEEYRPTGSRNIFEKFLSRLS